jgi:alpha-ribazole phosphatase/probable phosphoglycerate mutase
MSGTVLLVRHTAVALAWKGRCYGVSDVPLSREGRAAAVRLSIELAARQPAWVMHSGLARTRFLAERIATRVGCPLYGNSDWRERDFGAWEGQRWNAIYRASGNAMDGMIDAPHDFRPGGGETTHELADRVTVAWERLPDGDGIVVTHGGPIAAFLGRRSDAPVADWPALVPQYGRFVLASKIGAQRRVVAA